MKLFLFVFVAAGAFGGLILVEGIKTKQDAQALAGVSAFALLIWGLTIFISKKTSDDHRFAWLVPPSTTLCTMVATYMYFKYFMAP